MPPTKETFDLFDSERDHIVASSNGELRVKSQEKTGILFFPVDCN